MYKPKMHIGIPKIPNMLTIGLVLKAAPKENDKTTSKSISKARFSRTLFILNQDLLLVLQ